MSPAPRPLAGQTAFVSGSVHRDIEYGTDSSRPSSERSIAAFGLAGTADPEFARQALDKALANETDPDVKLDLERALALIGSDPR